MVKINLLLWIGSIVLQCGLLVVLFLRRLTPRLPLFTTLISFYILRSASLKVLASHVPRTQLELLFTILAVVDVLLQVAVAWEIFTAKRTSPSGLSGVPSAKPSVLARAALFSVLLVLAGAFGTLVALHLRANPRIPIDRGVLLSSTLLFEVFLVQLWGEAPQPVRRLAVGFAIYGVGSIAGQIGRTLAAADKTCGSSTCGPTQGWLSTCWLSLLGSSCSSLPI